jgi:hypothetical protein
MPKGRRVGGSPRQRGEAPMAQLTFRCPYTNKPIASGIELDRQSINQVDVAPEYPIVVHCPHCGFGHHGTIADGYLVAEEV